MSGAVPYVFFIVLAIQFFSQSSFALNWPEPTKCSPQIEKILAKFDFAADAKWKQADASSYANKAYKMESKKIGHWVVFETNKDGIDLVTYESSVKNFFKFKNKDCKITEENVSEFKMFDEKIDKKAKPFTDSDLVKLIGQNKKGVIYIWSPRMVYSVNHSEDYFQLAQKNKFEFTSLLAHDVSFNEANEALKSKKQNFSGRKLASVDLYLRDATLHYPTFLVYNNGQIHSKRIVGINTPEDFQSLINQYATELK